MAGRAFGLAVAYISQVALRLRFQENPADAGRICHCRSEGLRAPGEIQVVFGSKPYQLIRRPLAANTPRWTEKENMDAP